MPDSDTADAAAQGPELPSLGSEPPAPANLAALVSGHARSRPGAVALVGHSGSDAAGSVLTWSGLQERVETAAAGLAGLGLVAGQRVALCGRNSPSFVVAYLAALRAGLVVVPLDPEASGSEHARLIQESGARALLSDLGDAGSAEQPELRNVAVVGLSEEGLRDLASAGHGPVASPMDPEALAVLLTTAGTTGDPKIVMLTHRALLSHLEHLQRRGILGPDETILGAWPLFGVFGLGSVLGAWLQAGARLLVADPASDDLLALVRTHDVTHLPTTPGWLYRFLARDGVAEDLASVRTVVSAAAPLPWRLAQSFAARTGLRVEQGYGLTEAASGVSATFGGKILGPGHVGRALPGVEIRIGDGAEPSEPGEIVIRGRNLFSGYWPDGHGGPDEQGWFGTDDIGYLVDGELFLVDRARELLLVRGFRVYPSEVEQTIRDLDEVQAVAVVGRPDGRGGHHLVAFVAGPEVTAEAVLQHAASRLPAFKRPQEVRIVADLPRGVTGKVRRARLRQMLDDESGEAAPKDLHDG